MGEADKKYIVWVNYGYEGWLPTGFETLEQMEKYIIEGRDTYGNERIFTRKIEVKVKVDVTEEIGY
jgi:hypothetical protein